MNTQKQIPDGYGIIQESPLELHNPEAGIVISVHDRGDERHLTDRFPVRVLASVKQSNEYEGVFPDEESAETKAFELAEKLG